MDPKFRILGAILKPSAMGGQPRNKNPMKKDVLSTDHPSIVCVLGSFLGSISQCS